jgi:hypothetical protein
MKVIGMEYLERTLGETVRAICDAKYSCEVDPTRIGKDEDLSKNWPRLIGFVSQVWTQISESAADIPKYVPSLSLPLFLVLHIDFLFVKYFKRELRSIFKHIQKTANDKFGNDETRGSVRYTTVSGFLFLRFFCPAVLTPKFFGLLNGKEKEKKRKNSPSLILFPFTRTPRRADQKNLDFNHENSSESG